MTAAQYPGLLSCSHKGLMTYTDHRVVRMKLDLCKLHAEPNKKSQNMEKLRDTMTRARYAVNVEMNVIDSEDNWREKRKMNIQEMWIAITIKQQMIS